MSRKIICGVFIFLQIICVFITPWVIAFDNVNGVWLRLFEIPFYLLYYALLILGIIFLIIFYKQNQINSCMVLLLSLTITTIFIFPVCGIQQELVKFYEPLAKSQLTLKAHQDFDGYLQRKEKDYNALKEYFRNPCKVIKAKGSFLMLEDYKIIAIRGIEYPINDPASDLFLNNNVVGHYVSVDIGTLERFSGFYIPGTIGSLQTDLRGLPLDKQFEIPFFADIPAEVYLDGESLGDKLSLKWGSPVVLSDTTNLKSPWK